MQNGNSWAKLSIIITEKKVEPKNGATLALFSKTKKVGNTSLFGKGHYFSAARAPYRRLTLIYKLVLFKYSHSPDFIINLARD